MRDSRQPSYLRPLEEWRTQKKHCWYQNFYPGYLARRNLHLQSHVTVRQRVSYSKILPHCQVRITTQHSPPLCKILLRLVCKILSAPWGRRALTSLLLYTDLKYINQNMSISLQDSRLSSTQNAIRVQTLRTNKKQSTKQLRRLRSTIAPTAECRRAPPESPGLTRLSTLREVMS